MKLRYRIYDRYYIPQYKKDDESEWMDFKVKNIHGSLRKLCIAISNIQFYPSSYPIWHFSPNDNQNEDNMSLIFETDILVSAFLGSAKCWFTEKVQEFDI